MYLISEHLKPLPLEPLTFISTTPAAIKKVSVSLNNPVPQMVTQTLTIKNDQKPINNPVPQIATKTLTIKNDQKPINSPVPQMVTKMPLAKLKTSKMGLPRNFYRSNVPVQDLAESIIQKKKVMYQPRPMQKPL